MTEATAKSAKLYADPVFVLCGSRSGSTLLRFILDAHPDLACPPESKLPWLCWQLVLAWSVIEGVPQPPWGGDLSAIPDRVLAGVRQSMALMFGSHLERQGKKRFCDKTLASAPYAGALLRLYPQAKFLCLYRHPMDFISSGIEACPWGVSGYGFDTYVADDPGNTVAALGRCWADYTEQILAAEKQYPANCYRIRYEDLVAEPEEVAAAVFQFLGVAPAPGITVRCFDLDREQSGSGDYKIWGTSQITGESVGRGWSVPSHLLPAPLQDRVNGLAHKLGYVAVDERWGIGDRPADLRIATESHQSVARPGLAGDGGAELPPAGALLVADRVRAGLAGLDERFARKWQPYSTATLLLIAGMPARAGGNAWWRLDLAAGTATAGLGSEAPTADWSVTGSAEAWERVLRRETNLGVAFRRVELRYRDKSNGGPAEAEAQKRVAMMAALLGITQWQPGAQSGSGVEPGLPPDVPAADPERLCGLVQPERPL